MRALSILVCAMLILLTFANNRSMGAAGKTVELTVQTLSSGDALGVSADGKLAAVGSGNVVQLWDLERGRLVRKFPAAPNGDTLGKLLFLPNSTILVATITNKRRFTVSDFTTGQLIQLHSLSQTVAPFSIEDAYLTAAGYLATSGNMTNHAALWDIKTGRKLLEFYEPGPSPHARGIVGLRNFVEQIAVSPDGKLLVGRANTGKLVLFDALNGRVLRYFVAPEARDYRHTSVLSFSPDGRTVLESAYGDGEGQILHFWDVATGSRVRMLKHDGLYNYDRSALIAGSSKIVSRFSVDGPLKGKIAVWDIETEDVLQLLGSASAFHVHSESGRVVIVDSIEGLDVKTLSNGTSVLPRSTMASWQGQGSFLSKDELLVWGKTGPTGATGAVINVHTGALVGSHECFPTEYALLNEQRSLLACSSGFLVQDYANGIQFAKVSRIEDANPVAMTRSELIQLDGSRTLIRSDLATGHARSVQIARTAKDPTASLAVDFVSAEGRLLIGREISVGTGNLFKVWDAHTGKHLYDLSDPRSTATLPSGLIRQSHASAAHAFYHEEAGVIVTVGSPAWNGEDLALMSGRHELKLWSKDNGRLMKTIPIGRKNVRKLYEISGELGVTMLFWDGSVSTLDLKSSRIREILSALPGTTFGMTWGDAGMKYQFTESGSIVFRRDGVASPLASTVLSETAEWITITPEGFFASSPNGGFMLWAVQGMEMINIKQMFSVLYNPDLVRIKLQGDPDDEVKKAATILDLSKVLGSGPPPKLKVNLTQNTSSLVNVNVELEDSGGGLGRVEWRVNGLTVGVDSNEGQGSRFTRELALDPGPNLIETIAFNARNLISSEPTTWRLEGPAEHPSMGKLYVLAVGINSYSDPGFRNAQGKIERAPPLALAVGDAKAVATALSQSGRGIYDDVIAMLVLDRMATRSGLESAVRELAAKVRPEDTFVMFVAAHGRSENGQFFIIPSDFKSGPNALAEQAIDQRMLQDWIANKIKSKRTVLLLDTCESGAIISGQLNLKTGGGVTEASMGRLHEATGRPVLTASAAGQAALEGYKGHGVFSYAILDALKNSDRNNNDKIELSELAAYVQSLVPKLSPQLLEKGEAPFVQQPRFGSRGEDFTLAGRLH